MTVYSQPRTAGADGVGDPECADLRPTQVPEPAAELPSGARQIREGLCNRPCLHFSFHYSFIIYPIPSLHTQSLNLITPPFFSLSPLPSHPFFSSFFSLLSTPPLPPPPLKKRARVSLGYDAQVRDQLFNNSEAQLTEDMVHSDMINNNHNIII